jgi:hypothetical protein
MGERYAGIARFPTFQGFLMEQKLTIELAGQDYVIRPLTVGQLEALHIVQLQDAPKDEVVKDFWHGHVATIAAALSADHPEMTEEAVKKLRLGTLQKVLKTVQEIRLFAGLVEVVKKEGASDTTGEAPGQESSAA